MSVESYLASLPEVETARLPRGTLFVANGLIYQVTETGSGSYAKACQWRQNEKTEVALIPGSFLARHLPVVARGRPLPVYRSRNDLTFDGEPRGFVFPVETFALEAAYLDVALILRSGAYVRKNNDEPSFAVTDGAHIFRPYYYQQTAHGYPTTIVPHPRFEQRNYTEGPLYWQLLPGWSAAHQPAVTCQETDLDTTVVTRPNLGGSSHHQNSAMMREYANDG